MSTIESKLLQTDKIVAVDGTETTEVDIPSIDKKVCLAKCLYRTPAGSTSGGFSVDTFNVSSLTVKSNNDRVVNLIKGKEGATFAYGVSATGHDNKNGRFLEVFHYNNSDTRTSITLSYYTYPSASQTPQVYSTDIMIF